jgi:hypothetical protein
MPRTLTAAVLLALLALLTPGKAVAGPPEEASGKMVLDEVADGLRKYRAEKDTGKRIKWLEKLAPSHDPRVAVALGEEMDRALGQEDHALRWEAARLLAEFYVKGTLRFASLVDLQAAWPWWEKNEADLRRRAAQLPR